MLAHRFTYFFLLAGSLLACSKSSQKDPLLEEAARYHQQATEIQAALEPQIDQIDSVKTALLANGAPTARPKIATLDSLKTAFEAWEENLVEVPGMPHEHHHGEGEHHHHHHADATLKDLPADQMRDLQKETLAAIRQIQARWQDIVRAD